MKLVLVVLAVVSIVGIIIYLYSGFKNDENFWDSYTPIPATPGRGPGVETTRYGQTAVLANLDEPEIMIDCDALPVNSSY